MTCTFTNTQSQATLTIVKDTLPNGPQDFAFTTTGDGLSNFTLDDDTDPTLADRVNVHRPDAGTVLDHRGGGSGLRDHGLGV